LLAYARAVPLELAEAAVDAEGVGERKQRSLPSVLIVSIHGGEPVSSIDRRG
jgi:hypothetical protein